MGDVNLIIYKEYHNLYKSDSDKIDINLFNRNSLTKLKYQREQLKLQESNNLHLVLKKDIENLKV